MAKKFCSICNFAVDAPITAFSYAVPAALMTEPHKGGH